MATTTLLGLTLTLPPSALTALRITPLISSTASLTHAYMEWLTNSSFLVPAPVDSSLSRFLLGPEAPPETPSSSSLTPDDELEKAKDLVAPEWFTNFFDTGVVSVIGFNTATLVSASLNLAFPEELGESKIFYQIGLVAAVGHYAFVPLVGRSVRGLIGMAAGRRGSAGGKSGEAGGEGKAVEWVREWVGFHKIRMSTIDVLAWGCFAWGVVGAVTVK